VIVGVNRVFEHSGKSYHLQVEDLGLAEGSLEARVYDGGTVLWRKKIGYADVVAKGLDRLAFEDELRALMEKTVHTVEAAIAKGKLG
jgi:hypothetical protein